MASFASLRIVSSRASLTQGATTRYLSNKSSPSTSTSVFGDLFTSLRLGATNALTSSLSEKEKDQLLSRLNPSKTTPEKDTKDELVVERSIAEAVAEAKAKEAQRQEAKWEQKEKEILAQAEKAARDRVENEVKIQKQRMEFEKWEAARNDANGSTEAGVAEADHPVLGPATVDLGYKRIHVVSVEALATIPIWKKQRIYRHDRAKTMASDKMKTLHLGMPGIIGLHEVRSPNHH